MKISKRKFRYLIKEALDEENLKVYHGLKAKSSNYSNIEKMFIYGWGNLLYLSIELYKGIADSDLTPIADLEDVADEYLTAIKNKDTNALEELDDWLGDGGPMNDGAHLFNYKRLNKYLSSAASKTKLTKPLTIFRSDQSDRSLNEITAEWQSWSAGTSAERRYGNSDQHNLTVTLPIGTPVIYAHYLADAEEIIFKGPIPTTNDLFNETDSQLIYCIKALRNAGYSITK